ncbi:MAG: helix-turn-helix domain-containing protein [Gammaproteobacteria bacterium]|jgi:transcriptional regulator GlxA family with amidase domain
MKNNAESPIDVLILALPETAGSALYGLIDVLSSTGNLWQNLVRSEPQTRRFRIRVLSVLDTPFTCGNGIPVNPQLSIAEDPAASIVILPEIWLGPDESIHGRYPALIDWIRRRFDDGAEIYSACSGSILLAETGLLDGRAATSHWGYTDLFRRQYPKVRFDAAANLVYADPAARIVTAGGSTSWHDLALHIIARHAGPGAALQIAKVYLLKWHPEGQLPYTGLVRRAPHADSVARRAENWLVENYRQIDAIKQIVALSDVPERSLKRRFKAATGSTLIEYLQNLRVERAKQLFEAGDLPIEEVSAEVGYQDVSFFRRLFKRLTGLSPGQYRRMFREQARLSA